jgi:LysM repeat protein
MKYIKPHLSPELRAQITPSARRDVKLTAAGVFFLLASVALTINLWSRDNASLASNNTAVSTLAQSEISQISNEKAVLGESTQATAPTPSTLETAFTEYTVKSGDTLFNISQQYNIRWDLIGQINNLSEPYMLHAGQKLKIPQTTTSQVPGKIYTVQSGDTLARIATQYNITVNDIIAVNPNLQQSDLITVGQVIKLP